MKKISVLLLLLFVALASFGQTPLESIGLVFGLSSQDVQARLENRDLNFSVTPKGDITVDGQVESAGSQFANCTLIFKKGKLIEANFEQVFPKSDERIVGIKFSAISRALGENFILRRYMEKSRDGYYNGWKSDVNGYAMLKCEKQDDGTSRLNLIYSPKGLF